MAYNNGYPVTYPQMYYPYTQPTQSQQNSIIWVQGESGAKSYLVAPGNTVQLWDSERQTIYLKSADSSGMPSIKTLDYTIRESASTPPVGASTQNVDYATKADIEALKGQIEALKAKIKEDE